MAAAEAIEWRKQQQQSCPTAATTFLQCFHSNDAASTLLVQGMGYLAPRAALLCLSTARHVLLAAAPSPEQSSIQQVRLAEHNCPRSSLYRGWVWCALLDPICGPSLWGLKSGLSGRELVSLRPCVLAAIPVANRGPGSTLQLMTETAYVPDAPHVWTRSHAVQIHTFCYQLLTSWLHFNSGSIMWCFWWQFFPLGGKASHLVTRSESTNMWYWILPVLPFLPLASTQQMSLGMNLEAPALQRLGKIIFIAQVQEVESWKLLPGLQILVSS